MIDFTNDIKSMHICYWLPSVIAIYIDYFSRSMSIDFTQSARYQAHENHCTVLSQQTTLSLIKRYTDVIITSSSRC